MTLNGETQKWKYESIGVVITISYNFQVLHMVDRKRSIPLLVHFVIDLGRRCYYQYIFLVNKRDEKNHIELKDH